MNHISEVYKYSSTCTPYYTRGNKDINMIISSNRDHLLNECLEFTSYTFIDLLISKNLLSKCSITICSTRI